MSQHITRIGMAARYSEAAVFNGVVLAESIASPMSPTKPVRPWASASS